MFKNTPIISAPFGNYITLPGCVSTLGTFTLHKRNGPLYLNTYWKILKTLRYRFKLHSWQNKLGLPNPGINYLTGKDFPQNIVSIYGFDRLDWVLLLRQFSTRELATPLAIELNVSCPNLDHEISIAPEIFDIALKTGIPIIVKLPPINYWPTFLEAYTRGIRLFHCCNTLPHPKGGLSGEILHPISIKAVKEVYNCASKNAATCIIGGGGVKDIQTAIDFKIAGADTIAIGSALFNPFFRYKKVYDVIDFVKKW